MKPIRIVTGNLIVASLGAVMLLSTIVVFLTSVGSHSYEELNYTELSEDGTKLYISRC